jgi:hypothetical protein
MASQDGYDPASELVSEDNPPLLFMKPYLATRRRQCGSILACKFLLEQNGIDEENANASVAP